MTADREEIARFEALAEEWWDPMGPMRPLHALNPVRLAWIRALACRHFGRDERQLRPLGGLAALDVGCGGGLLAEPLARLGALVVAIDPAAASIEVARRHAAEVGLAIDYRVATAADLADRGETFDLVCALEVIEHVDEPEALVADLARLTRRGGLLLLSTLNRTLASLLGGILAAEWLLGWLPPGTHDWRRFLRPSELARMLRTHGLQPVALTGVGWDAAHDRFVLVRQPSINYMLAAVRS
ncbi:Ubiquinone biosynthesis O-methyltransferase [bacterium HR40]|nr:Ubiquinone biosynthesis O-methyltransferase [bacterium HR40]